MVTVKSVFCGEELILETGLLAKQAHGSVTLRLFSYSCCGKRA